jgi:leucyl-tRNA synthetase
MKRYNPKDIEPFWQQKWEEDKIYQASEDTTKAKRYVLEYFPYPSGAAMHVGHVRNYTIGDAIARFWRQRGYNVLHPMGWDAFGLPAENYAIKNNISPKQAILENTTKFKQQLQQMGFSYDWSREVDSSDPAYYKWTQWFFKLLFERGLAYQKESLQWWCETDKTVLANEQVEAGKCWRCGNEVTKKSLNQWFFKITDYADRLVDDLEDLDWSESIKSMQRNWIGKSKGAEIHFDVDSSDEKLTVYTTRPDTIFGATFMVVAPEHPILQKITTSEQKSAVEEYVRASQAKSDVERQETDREKTGVFSGAYAVNPLNGAMIPIWTSDYVLYGYGTGAIMAVPAHDERDFEFAQKFELDVIPVIGRVFVDDATSPKVGEEFQTRDAVQVIIKHPTDETYFVLNKLGWDKELYGYVNGGVEADETPIQAAVRELAEEAGFSDYTQLKEVVAPYFAELYHQTKGYNLRAKMHTFYTQLNSLAADEVSEEEKKINEPLWVSAKELVAKIHGEGARLAFQVFLGEFQPDMVFEGRLINSGEFNDTSSDQAREVIVSKIQELNVGNEKTQYKIRDWLISRQRYWGAPIPIIHCEKDGAVAVPDDQLPVELPEVKSYAPTGRGSVLETATDWVNTTCPKCGGPAKRETDTMDGFACSSWYFLRFADPHNEQAAFDADKAKFWLPVDDYIGGAEHAVMHLLYARMWTKVMYDAGLVDFKEPFKALRNQGMILAPDGRKMSKSWGNVIAPDDIITQGYGADSVRVMELFIGPWDQAANWSVEGMGGCYRFLNRIWTLAQEFQEDTSEDSGEDKEVIRLTHQLIEKVSRDLEHMQFNTAISAMMEYVNELFKVKAARGYTARASWNFALTALSQVLAPFAPHIAEEIWHQLGNEASVHVAPWPVHDPQYLVADQITIVVQVNGKVRANLQVPSDASKEDIESQAMADQNVQKFMENKKPAKVVYVPGRLVNIVV